MKKTQFKQMNVKCLPEDDMHRKFSTKGCSKRERASLIHLVLLDRDLFV